MPCRNLCSQAKVKGSRPQDEIAPNERNAPRAAGDGRGMMLE
jgi:hypothetical protein